MMFKQRDRQQKETEMRGKKRGAAGGMQKLPMGAKTKKAFGVYLILVLMLTMGGTTVFAAGDPIAVVNNLSEFIFGLIRAIGMILLGFGIVQIGLSLKSHDPSQRANGFLTLAGGVVITFCQRDFELDCGIKKKQAGFPKCKENGLGNVLPERRLVNGIRQLGSTKSRQCVGNVEQQAGGNLADYYTVSGDIQGR